MTTSAARRRAAAPPRVAASVLPIARVAVELSLPHLDRLFDYLVPSTLDEVAQPGVRVKVRFAGRLVDGYLTARVDATDHVGKLGFLDKVVSAEQVLTPEILALAQAVADRYAGTVADVLRLAIPPRHARAEAAAADESIAGQPISAPDAQAWDRYEAGRGFLAAVGQGRAPRAVWQCLPGESWPDRLLELARAAAAAGRGALLLVPDARDLERLTQAAVGVLGADQFTTLSADVGPAERYRRFLRIRRGQIPIVAGTRAAAFAPVQRLGLVAVFDDGDDLLAEPRAPYPHAREIAMLRSAAGAALVVAGFSRTAEAQLLVESGWAHHLGAARSVIRECSPRIQAAGDSFAAGADSAAAHARISPAAFSAARSALAAGSPVLAQVPRRGYLPSLVCGRCREAARCRRCHGPLAKAAAASIPACRWCGVPEAGFRCGMCGSGELRAPIQGALRTAEELGRAFAGVPVITSAGEHIRDSVPAEPAIVVATPGAEPIVPGGYGAALLLDGAGQLLRAELHAAENTLRRWLGAAALVRPHAAGGQVVLGVDGSAPLAQAVIRWDPVGFAAAELEQRRELAFPPAVAMASLEGAPEVVADALAELDLPPTGMVLGPVPITAGRRANDDGDRVRALVRVEQAHRRSLASALKTVARQLSARKDALWPRIQVDPALDFE